jgi:hypothetical protein
VAFFINIECLPFVLGNAYNSEERIVCSGYDNGDIKMFDLKTMSLRWETNVKNGVSLHPQYSFLVLYLNNFNRTQCLASELVNLSVFCCWLAHVFCDHATYGGCFPPREIEGD